MHLMLCGNCRRFISQLKVVRDILRRNLPAADNTRLQATVEKLHAAYHEKNKS
jgi:hypothetical protein